MKKYRVVLVRSFVVDIEAEYQNQALRSSEFYIGNCLDLSTPKDRERDNFKINDIEMTFNEALEAEEIFER